MLDCLLLNGSEHFQTISFFKKHKTKKKCDIFKYSLNVTEIYLSSYPDLQNSIIIISLIESINFLF